MSHKEIHQSSKVYAYSREFHNHSNLWFENAVGDPMACLIFEHNREHESGDGVWECQFPPTKYSKKELREHMWIAEKYLKSCDCNLIWGMANRSLGEFLISIDPRFYWEIEGEEGSEIIVGNNTKRKLYWNFLEKL